MHNRLKLGMLSLVAVFLSGCVAAAPVVAAGAAGTGGANVAGSTLGIGQQYDDLSIKGSIATIIQNIPGLAGANVEVTVFNGIVLLLGQVPTQDMKDQLATQVSQIKGVVIVYNQLSVGPNVTFSRFADDAWITSKVKTNMVGQVNPLHFKVVTQEGVVYLLGQVTEDEGNQAAQIAAQTSGVVKVVKIFNYIYPTAATPTSISGSAVGTSSSSVNATSAVVVTSTAAEPPAQSAAPVTDASSTSASVTPTPNPSSIPQYAPNYTAPAANESVGPAASD